VSQTLDTCRQKCQKLRHPRPRIIASQGRAPCLQSVAMLSVRARFGSGGAPYLAVEADRYLKMVYFLTCESGVHPSPRSRPCSALAGLPPASRAVARIDAGVPRGNRSRTDLRRTETAKRRKNNDDASDFRNRGGCGAHISRDRIHTPIAQEPATARTWRGQEAAPVGLGEQKEETVTGDLTISLRLHPDFACSRRSDKERLPNPNSHVSPVIPAP
jgi:hypothetical protein